MGFSRYVFSYALLLFAFTSADDPVFKYAKDTLGSEHGEIIFSAMVFRHGDRYACGDFPTNEHSALFRAHRGLLTEAGKIRVHRLGRWTRKRYQLLDKGRDDDLYSIEMISSPSPRVLLSAELFLRGFHHPEEEDLEGQHPWEVTAMPRDDRMMTMREHCARYNVEADAVKKLPDFVSFFESHRELHDSIEKFTGLKLPLQDSIKTVAKIALLYDTLNVMKQLNLKLPEWWMPEIDARLREFSVMFFKLHTFTQTMKRLKAGPLLGHIVSELEGARDNRTPGKKLQFYAGHDSNIVALLDVFGLWNCDGTNCVSAPYSSALLFELRRNGEELLVTLLYRKDENSPPKLMAIPHCPTPCKLENFIQFAKRSFIPTDWADECKIEAGDRSDETDYNTVLF